jgi:hypothetical protein
MRLKRGLGVGMDNSGLVKTKNPVLTGFFGTAKSSIYSWIELETFCADLSGSSKQPVKPMIIKAIAITDSVFFIRISSKGVSIIFINLRH